MKSKFNEEIETSTRYNLIPRWMRKVQRQVCAGCDYRIYQMQYRIAQEEAIQKGGSPRNYLNVFWMQPIPSCKRGRCLLDKLVLMRGAQAPSSLLKRLLKAKVSKEYKEAKMKKITFVCKYNRFRSKIAEAYFKKINKNKSILSGSAGVILGTYPLDNKEVRIAKKLGITLSGRPRSLTSKEVSETDLIVIVADNVPKEIFRSKNGKYRREVRVWDIADVSDKATDRKIENTIKQIMLKVEQLAKELK
jgi:protein-tyrosine-phosphatase